MRTFTRFVVSGVCLVGIGGHAGAESASEFWQSEWQRQQPRVSSLTPSWQGGGAFREQGERFGGQKPLGYSGIPEERSLRVGNPRPSRGKMPTVRVSNPDFFTYVPDKLTNVALGSVCEFKTASNGGPAGDNKPQDSGASDVTATPAVESSPASAFAQACAASPAIAMRLMPQVGEAIARHYSKHPQLLWSDPGSINAKAQAALTSLAASDAVGLDPADYRVAVPDLQNVDAGERPLALLRFELALSAKVLTYVLDATRGRIDPNRLSGYHDLPRKSIDLVDALSTIAQSTDITAYLVSRNPENFQFRALVAELARQRGEDPQGKTAKLRMALEQLRWLPPQLGTRYVFLNEPAFEVSYFNGAGAPLTMRAIIGKPNAQTYFFTDRIKEITYNPYWNVPRSIVINEMLPKLWRDPSYLDRLGYEVSNSRGREVASNSVDWAAVATQQIVDVRQPPGRGNALGRLKIDFPNKHAIYMHDTNQKHLFAREQRALSHGYHASVLR